MSKKKNVPQELESRYSGFLGKLKLLVAALLKVVQRARDVSYWLGDKLDNLAWKLEDILD